MGATLTGLFPVTSTGLGISRELWTTVTHIQLDTYLPTGGGIG